MVGGEALQIATLTSEGVGGGGHGRDHDRGELLHKIPSERV